MSSVTDNTRANKHAESHSPLGANLRVSLVCPKCRAVGWIKWASLSRAIHCPKCNCEFLLVRNGELRSLGDLPQARFTCPRCGKSGSLPSTSIVRNAQCADCKLPLVEGPDQRLHSASEAAKMQREAAVKTRATTHRAWLRDNIVAADGRVRRLRLVLLLVIVACALAAAARIIPAFNDTSIESTARQFAYACLADDRSALGFLEDDPVQAAEFERFHIRQFASLLDKYRPAGDRVTIDVVVLRETANTRAIEVRLTSDFLGTRSHIQIWGEHEGRWLFDAQATLATQDKTTNEKVTNEKVSGTFFR